MEQPGLIDWHDDEEWEVLKWGVLNNDIVLFDVKNVKTGEIIKGLEANRGGWEWGVGERLCLDIYGL